MTVEATRLRSELGVQLALDAAAVEVVRAFTDAGIRAILLKGPAVATRLYDDRADRPYGDIDLLVSPESRPRATSILSSLGFVDAFRGARSFERDAHASPWQRDRIAIDLHVSLPACVGDARDVWRELAARTRRIDLAGTEIEVLDDAALALLVALHAVHHRGATRPLNDLRRGIAVLDGQAWCEAANIADRLDSGAILDAALRLDPAGTRLKDELPLAPASSPIARLWIEGRPPLSVGLARMAATDRNRDRAILILGKLLPSQTWMRHHVRIARRGGIGLVLAYFYWPLQVAYRFPAALRAWRRAARSTQSSESNLWRISRFRALNLGNVRGAMWAWGASDLVRQQLRDGGLEALSAPNPPSRAGVRGVSMILRRRHLTCLELAAVRQRWHAAQGVRRDIVIGVNNQGEFGAHAWLDGDPPQEQGDHIQLLRWPADRITPT